MSPEPARPSAEEIVLALAELEPPVFGEPGYATYCLLCAASGSPTAHYPSCPWRQAREYRDARKDGLADGQSWAHLHEICTACHGSGRRHNPTQDRGSDAATQDPPPRAAD